MRTQNQHSHGFTRTELLVVAGTLGLLLAVTFSALAGSRGAGQKAGCMNNLRRLGLAMLMYSAENGGKFPPRTIPNSWAERIRPYYKELNLLRCPAEVRNPRTYASSPFLGDSAPRSYICNGWNDYFYEQTASAWTLLVAYMATNSMAEAAFKWSAETIILGEKYSDVSHLYMDSLLPSSGNEVTEVDQGHHFKSSQQSNSGGSNYAFVDGSVRFLDYGQAFYPVNLWATVEAWRFSIIP
jgi:prepilin-type processing-associated H-X9-DG protein